MAAKLTADQVVSYQQQGYLALRSVLSKAELDRVAEALMRAAWRGDASPADPPYPAPARVYTVSENIVEDLDLAYIVRHPTIVEAAQELLGGPVVFQTFVCYIKTPGAKGTGKDKLNAGSHSTAHQDYKPYHQAGSSLNWLFAIVPLVDLDAETGPLYVSPGSHKFSSIERQGRIHRVRRSQAQDIAPLVNLQLRRGDLMLMNMFTWHEGGPNQSSHDRMGVYNKYRAANAPPAWGPDLFSDVAHRTVVYRGQSLLPHHSDRPITGTRLLMEHDQRYLMVRDRNASGDKSKRWRLPGAPRNDSLAAVAERPGIEALETNIRATLGIDIHWATYIGDFEEGGALLRVFAHGLPAVPTLRVVDEVEAGWFTGDQIRTEIARTAMADGFVRQAIDLWTDESFLRGVGESKRRAQSLSAAFVG